MDARVKPGHDDSKQIKNISHHAKQKKAGEHPGLFHEQSRVSKI
jgi:hypothetical protein